MRKVLLFALFCVLPASATTRYIAQTAGTFSGGTACNGQTAITVATFNGLTLAAGDLTWVCGTVTIAGAGSVGINFGSNQGSIGNPLILKFDTSAILACASYCLGGGGGTNGGAIALGTGNSYITIDGNSLTGTVENGLNGSAGATCPLGTCNVQHSSTLISGFACNQCIVQNLNLVDSYVNTINNTTIADSSVVTAIQFSGNWTITGNIIHDCGWCVIDNAANGDSGISVSSNEFYNFAHGYVLSPQTGAAVSNVFENGNNFHDSANWGAAGCFAHINVLHMFGNATSSVDNFYFLNNWAHGNWGTCPTGAVFVEGGGSGTPAHLNNATFANNLIDATNAPTDLTNGWFDVFAGDTGAQKVLNNTVIGPNSTDNTLCYAFSGETGHVSMSGLTFENNATKQCGNPVAIGISGFTVTLVSANNNFYGPFGANAFTFNDSNKLNLAAWKTACSCDSASIQNNTPLMNADGSPQAGSPVIGAGLNLTSLATGNLSSLQNDTTLGSTRTTNLRPSVAAWDIGAFEFAAAPPTASGSIGNGAVISGGAVIR